MIEALHNLKVLHPFVGDLTTGKDLVDGDAVGPHIAELTKLAVVQHLRGTPADLRGELCRQGQSGARAQDSRETR